MRRLLFVRHDPQDLVRLSATLEDEPYHITSTCAHGATELLSTSQYDAVVISERCYQGTARPHTTEVIALAERLAIPVLVFPAIDGVECENLERLIPVAPPNRTRNGRSRSHVDRERLDRFLDEMIRPSFQTRGGEIELVDVIGEQVVLRFLGICAGCPSARNKHRREIEKFLRSEIPGVKFVVIEQNGFPPGRWW